MVERLAAAGCLDLLDFRRPSMLNLLMLMRLIVTFGAVAASLLFRKCSVLFVASCLST